MSRLAHLVLLSIVAAVGGAALLAPAAAAQSSCGGLFGLFTQPCPSPAPRPAPAPDPGGQEEPDQPVPAEGKRFGFNSSLAVAGDATPAQELDAVAAAGANMHRAALAWRNLQPSQSDPPLAADNLVQRVDAFYAAALERGITPVFVFISAPAWASKYRDCGLLDFECQRIAATNRALMPDWPFLDEFRRLITAVKNRWPAAIVEPWNTPNLYWQDSRYPDFAADPAHYSAIQCAAYRGSKAVNDGPVLAAGWAMRKYREYVGGVYAAGGARCWDLANLHAYPGGTGQLGAGSGLARMLDTARELRSRYGDADPLWVTETGYSTTGPNKVTGETQADASRRLYNRLVTMEDIDAVIFHTLKDPVSGYPAGTDQYGFGFLRRDWSAKAVYCGFESRAGGTSGRC